MNNSYAAGIAVVVHYDGAQALAQRVREVEEMFPGRARMISGDVTGAFRHIPVDAEHVGRFSGSILDL